jgi:hypothetical protein
MVGKLKTMLEGPDSQIFNIIRQMSNWIKETLIAKALPALEDFVNPETSSSFGSGEILGRIKEALVRFWNELATEMSSNKRGDSDPMYLVLARITSEWSKGVVESIFSMYNERLFVKASNGIYIPGLSESDINRSAADTATKYANLSKKLVSKFVMFHLSRITFDIRGYAQRPTELDQVSMVSRLWRNADSTMKEIHLQAKANFKEEAKAGPKGAVPPPVSQPSHGRQGTNASTGGKAQQSSQPLKKNTNTQSMQFDTIMDTLDKLFDEKLTFFPQSMELKAPLVMSVLCKCILKVFFQYLRL